jgi:hypothetical protein
LKAGLSSYAETDVVVLDMVPSARSRFELASCWALAELASFPFPVHRMFDSDCLDQVLDFPEGLLTIISQRTCGFLRI